MENTVTDQNVQAQIDGLNRKLDLILEEVYAQKAARENVEDLASDLSIVTRDIFKNTVIELDKAGIEWDSDAVAGMGTKLIRNLGTIKELLDTLESINDFQRDLSPILHQAGLDTIKKMHELEQKGYIDFFREITRIFDNIVTHFSPEDVRALADNVVTILETVKNLTQPDMLAAVNNAVMIFKNLDPNNVEEYSIWKVMREFNKPEMKRGLGFIITFMKNLSNEQVAPSSNTKE